MYLVNFLYNTLYTSISVASSLPSYGKVRFPMPSFDPDNQDILEDEFGDMLGEVSLRHFHTKPNAT